MTDAPETDAAARKRRRIRFVQHYFVNPPVRLAARFGVVPGVVLVETKGRRSGRKRRTPVGMHLEGDTGWVISEQGRHASYVRNLETDPKVRVCIGRRWHDAHAEVVPDDDVDARLESFGRKSHSKAVRKFGTDLRTVRFDFASAPGDPSGKADE